MNTTEPGLSAPAWPSDEGYRGLEHTGSLKGLLKPFKGKGELDRLARLAQRTEEQLAALMAGLDQRAKHPPCSLLDLRLCRQNTRAGIPYLRWRSRDFSRMGVAVWAQQFGSASLTHPLREALYRLEIERITLNLQMSLMHSLYRQAMACASKMAHAEDVLRQSLFQQEPPA